MLIRFEIVTMGSQMNKDFSKRMEALLKTHYHVVSFKLRGDHA